MKLTLHGDVTDGTLYYELLAVVALRSPHLLVTMLAFSVELYKRKSHSYKLLKGALYRIWCGVNRLSDSGVKVE